MNTLTIRRPHDMHVHFREGPLLGPMVRHTARYSAGALVMPNTVVPITTHRRMSEYYEEIMHWASSQQFRPLMTLKLTQDMQYQTVFAADNLTPFPLELRPLRAIKLYPAGVTTNSHDGITDPFAPNLRGVYEYMVDHKLVLCVHGERPMKNMFEEDVFKAEKAYLPVIKRLMNMYPGLKIVLEHVSTKAGVNFVRENGPNLAATITAHHMRFNLNHLLAHGLCPHWYCKPLLKKEKHRLAVLAAATSGNPKFFLGSDSAPHLKENKETSCCAAGAFTAPILLQMLADTFEQAGALDKLEAFTSIHGPEFYDIKPSDATITLVREPMLVPELIDGVVPIMAGATLPWSLQD